MAQQSLIDELSDMIKAGLQERNVLITKPGWLIEFGGSQGRGWNLKSQLHVDTLRPIGDEQLVVFRDEAEIQQILQFLPVPGPVSTLPVDVEALVEQLIRDVDNLGVTLIRIKDEAEGHRTMERFMPRIRVALRRLQEICT